MVEQGNKQVRVDNWGTFFLQRLQVFFAKTDYCDLTLQFDGNVQLKVHRLVMNACTEYFGYLEESCPALEENIIMMPGDLQSDVIVPIVNFMYTGMLEFHVSLFDKLYRAAELMNINILTKLLDAQKTQQKVPKSRPEPPIKKPPPPPKPSYSLEPPAPVPVRKVSGWKRKPVSKLQSPVSGSTSHPTSQLHYDQKWSHASDPLADNTPKPTRFEWPEDDLPSMSLMDSSFQDISYTSKPLLTKEEEDKIKPCFDDLRHNVELPKKNFSKSTNNTVSLKDMEEFAKEQKIRTAMFEDPDEVNDFGQKRKGEQHSPAKVPTKKIKISNKENKETTISVESVTPGDIDHTKIVTEILKKYPDLVKKNKNIKLKIMAGSKDTGDKKVVNAVVEPVKRPPPKPETVIKTLKPNPVRQFLPKRKPAANVSDDNDEGPWVCKKCVSSAGEVQEFVLYYLYRKHMTDVHDEVFDTRLCKYCGHRCNTHNLMLYHLYTKHALKPPASYNFPKCNRCPYIALSAGKLLKHKEFHNSNEMQCQDCQLAFVSAQYLTAHIRVTGHYNKHGRVSYDCQYCMKKLQSGMTLFSHIRKSHTNEAKRDGMVCFYEMDSVEDLEDEDDDNDDEEGEEYIIPEILSESGLQKDKVKIISNVKVPPNRQDANSTQQSQLVPLETSSEADSLNNVATGIATSLGLVDIVVLDDNQQYILQQDGQNEQTEFIIPDLAHGQPFAGQVITTQDNGVIQQGMIQSNTGDIGSTDELVMVLTDHDYPDDHEDENPENSNIVVLYSHPVDGQEGQFITSQGNLMVNSQTGMLELRNGSTIASTTASQMIVTNSVDTPIESIEMIQREIDGHPAELKQEPYFEEDRKPEIHQLPEQAAATKIQKAPEIQDVAEPEPEESPSENQIEQSTSTEEPSPAVETEEHIEEPADESSEQVQEEEEFHEDKDASEDNVDGSLEVSAEEPMEIDEIEHKTAETEDQEEDIQDQPEEHPLTDVDTCDPQEPVGSDKDEQEQHDVYTQESAVQNENDGVDVPPEKTSSDPQEGILNEPSFIETGLNSSAEQTDSNLQEQQSQDEEQLEEEGEPMEVDGKVEEDRIQDAQQEEERGPGNGIEESIEQSGESEPVGDEPETAVSQEEEETQVSQEEEEAQVSQQEEETHVSQEEETHVSQEEEEEEETHVSQEEETHVSQEEEEDEEETHVSQEEEEEIHVSRAEAEERVSQEEVETHFTQGEEEMEMSRKEETLQEERQIDENPANQTTDDRIPQKPVPPVESKKSRTDINKTILDDWADDTDSQQSDKNGNESQDTQVSSELNKEEPAPSAVDNVNKLMDDWDEEEEEEKK